MSRDDPPCGDGDGGGDGDGNGNGDAGGGNGDAGDGGCGGVSGYGDPSVARRSTLVAMVFVVT